MSDRIRKLVRGGGAFLAVTAAGALLLAGCGSTPTTATSSAPTPTGQLFMQVDQVSVAKETSCWVMSVYHPGEGVYFRAKVFDPATGKSLGKGDLQAVNLSLPNGQNLAMTFAGHPGTNPTDSFWGVLWKVPADYPTGTVQYSVTAKANDGREGKYAPFNVSSSLLQIA